jgi:hypothetical protein
MHNTEAMVHGLRRGLGLLVELMADVFQQSRFGNLSQGLRRLLPPPAGEVQQVVSISAQRTRRELADALGIEEVVGPGDLVALLIE